MHIARCESISPIGMSVPQARGLCPLKRQSSKWVWSSGQRSVCFWQVEEGKEDDISWEEFVEKERKRT